MADEIRKFVSKLLEKPPASPSSIELVIDTEGDVHGMFEVLLMIMTEILKKWYPPPITIEKISDEDLVRLIDYFASFGVRFQLTITVGGRILSNREYLQKSRLEDMTFQISNGQKRYTVVFSMI